MYILYGYMEPLGFVDPQDSRNLPAKVSELRGRAGHYMIYMATHRRLSSSLFMVYI